MTAFANFLHLSEPVSFTLMIRPLFRRSPSAIKIAGSNVTELSTAMATTIIPPSAIFWKISTLIMNIAPSPMNTQKAEKITDRPAVWIVVAVASSTSLFNRSSRYRLMNSNEKSMLNASPSIGTMFKTKIARSICPPIRDNTPKVVAIVVTPTIKGTIDAMIVPNANSKTMIAIGKPIASAFIRSR